MDDDPRQSQVLGSVGFEAVYRGTFCGQEVGPSPNEKKTNLAVQFHAIVVLLPSLRGYDSNSTPCSFLRPRVSSVKILRSSKAQCNAAASCSNFCDHWHSIFCEVVN